jgi:hypothetical protein
MAMQQIAEGGTPDFANQDYEEVIIPDKEWGLRVGLTRTQIENAKKIGSSFDLEREISEALKAAARNEEAEIMRTLCADFYNSTGNITNAQGGWKTPPGYGSNTFATTEDHLVAAGSTTLALSHLTAAMKHIAHHGYKADTILLNSVGLEKIQNLAGWTTAMTPNPLIDEIATTRFVGQIYGLKVYTSEWVPLDSSSNPYYIILDASVKPVALFEMRPTTIDLDNNIPFGAEGRFITHRYGVKVAHPGAGYVLHLAAAWADPTINE